jgi:hypothetical protein
MQTETAAPDYATESEDEPTDAAYTRASLRDFALRKFPFPIRNLPCPDSIEYQVQLQLIYPHDQHGQIAIRVGTIIISGVHMVVLAACQLNGSVFFYYELGSNIGVKLSRKEKARIIFYYPWYHLKTNEPRGRLREVCAMVAFYLLRSPIRKLKYFKNCGTHERKDFWIACLRMVKEITKEQGVDPETLTGVDGSDWSLEDMLAPSVGAHVDIENGGVKLTDADREASEVSQTDGDSKTALFRELLDTKGHEEKAQSIRARWEDRYGPL